VSDLLPAWSEPFHDDVTAHRLGLEHPVTRAWAYGDGSGRGVRVAVIDSGVESGHRLVGDVVGGAVLTLDASADDGVHVVEGPHGDLYGHGTACAGIIRSLAPEVELLSVQVLGSNLKGSARTFARGLEWCIDRGVDIVNLSLSTANDRYFETFHDLVDRASFAKCAGRVGDEQRTQDHHPERVRRCLLCGLRT
jgi:subtilisin